MLNISSRVVFVTRDVRFYEGIYPYKLFSSVNGGQNSVTRKELCQSVPVDIEEGKNVRNDDLDEDQVDQEIDSEPEINVEQAAAEAEQQDIPAVRHSTRTHQPPQWLSDYHTYSVTYENEPVRISGTADTHTSQVFACFLSECVNHQEPKHYKEAVKPGIYKTL